MLEERNVLQEVLYFLRWKLGAVIVTLPGHIAFVLRGFGAQRGPGTRLALAMRMAYIHMRVPCAHTPMELLQIVEEIIELPEDDDAPFVECGCFNWGSSAKMSHAVAVAGRRLVICDSFEGLPGPSEVDAVEDKENFQQGDFRAALPLVRRTIERYGQAEFVDYVPGWFVDSLPTLDPERIAGAYLDVDLRSSVEDCLRHLWWRLKHGGLIFVHDVDRPSVVAPFEDHTWWKENVGGPRPELIGALDGLGPHRRLLGYACKSR
jgi:O-methyltransferase/8-demethyl-8-(2,3-dimethoxy-alpha-L-rhamnosyl)tetracenomycin-C 4'-O-methyltransferase